MPARTAPSPSPGYSRRWLAPSLKRALAPRRPPPDGGRSARRKASIEAAMSTSPPRTPHDGLAPAACRRRHGLVLRDVRLPPGAFPARVGAVAAQPAASCRWPEPQRRAIDQNRVSTEGRWRFLRRVIGDARAQSRAPPHQGVAAALRPDVGAAGSTASLSSACLTWIGRANRAAAKVSVKPRHVLRDQDRRHLRGQAPALRAGLRAAGGGADADHALSPGAPAAGVGRRLARGAGPACAAAATRRAPHAGAGRADFSTISCALPRAGRGSKA